MPRKQAALPQSTQRPLREALTPQAASPTEQRPTQPGEHCRAPVPHLIGSEARTSGALGVFLVWLVFFIFTTNPAPRTLTPGGATPLPPDGGPAPATLLHAGPNQPVAWQPQPAQQPGPRCGWLQRPTAEWHGTARTHSWAANRPPLRPSPSGARGTLDSPRRSPSSWVVSSCLLNQHQ